MSAQEQTQLQNTGIPTVAQMMAELEALKQENAKLLALAVKKAAIPGTLTEKGNFTLGEGCYCKVSEKGAVSIYGFGKWPVTLYKDQLFRLAKVMELVVKFAHDNDSKLNSKPAPAAVAATAAVIVK